MFPSGLVAVQGIKRFSFKGRNSKKLRCDEEIVYLCSSGWGIYVCGLLRVPHHQADQYRSSVSTDMGIKLSSMLSNGLYGKQSSLERSTEIYQVVFGSAMPVPASIHRLRSQCRVSMSVTCHFWLVMGRYQDGGKSRLARSISHKVYVVEQPGTRICRYPDARMKMPL